MYSPLAVLRRIFSLMQASGWGIVIGFGAFFALFAGSLVYLDIAFSGEVLYTNCTTQFLDIQQLIAFP